MKNILLFLNAWYYLALFEDLFIIYFLIDNFGPIWIDF